MIPGLEGSFREGIDHPLLYSQTFLMAQRVKSLPAVQDPWVRSLGCEDPLEEDVATHSHTLAWRIHMNRGAWKVIIYMVTKHQT